MATVPANIVIAWPGTNASIPANWSRVTALDSKYIRGTALNGDADTTTAFGAANHSHTETGHTPTQNSHTHSVSSGASTGAVNYVVAAGNSLASNGHTHAALASDATTATNNSSTATFGASTDNDPPYRKVIWITSNGSPTGFPANSYIFFSSNTLPSGWSRAEGGNFLKGAAAGADGSGTGGSATHTHTETGTHTHTQNAHTHTGTSDVNSGSIVASTTTANGAADGHHHTYTLNSTTATNNASSTSITASNGTPLHTFLNIITNTTSTDYPDQAIVLYNGTFASIPTDYTEYTAMNGQFLRGSSVDGDTGTTGGSSTHTHTGTCTTTSPTHTHTITAGTADLAVRKGGTTTASVASTGHTHTWTISSDSITHQNATITLSANTSESAFPLYQKLIFVKYTAPGAGGATTYPTFQALTGFGI